MLLTNELSLCRLEILLSRIKGVCEEKPALGLLSMKNNGFVGVLMA